MKKILFLLAAAALFAFANDAKSLFEQKCMVCHIASKPTPKQRSKMSAPPAFGVMYHVKERYPKRSEAVDFIVEYAMNPDKKRALCMPMTIERFGLMPSLKGIVTEDELRAIADYMYDNFPPEWFTHPKRGAGCSKKGCASGACGKNGK